MKRLDYSTGILVNSTCHSPSHPDFMKHFKLLSFFLLSLLSFLPSPPFKVTLYTDGACSGNPGPGGYGAILVYVDSKGIKHEKEIKCIHIGKE